MEIFKLFGSIFVDNTKANEGIAKTEEKALTMGEKLGGAIATAGKWALGIGTAAVAAGAALFTMAVKTSESADEIDKLSERTGINREELQRWKYAAGQSGADIGKLEVGIKKLSESMVGAGEGSQKNIDAFGQLGISIDDLKNKSQEDIFAGVMKGLASMPEGAERNALGNSLLGKSYTELMPLLNAGADGMQDLMNRADELGIVLSEESIKANVKFGDSLADVKLSVGAVVEKLTTAALPIFQQMLDWVLDHMPEIQEVFGKAFGVIAKVVEVAWDWFDKYLLPIFDKVFKWVGENWPQIQSTIKAVFDVINPLVKALWSLISETLLPIFIDLWRWVSDNFGWIGDIVVAAFKNVIDFATDVVAGLTNVIDTIKDTVNWFKELFGWNGKKVTVNAEVKETGGAGGRFGVDGSHALGLDYVPYDGYIAELHKGETVLPANKANQSADIRVYLDSDVLVEAIGQPLVERIRIKTGVRG